MNSSIARTHRSRRLLALGAALGTAAVLTVAGCSSDGNVSESTAEPTASEEESAPAPGGDTGEVPDVTNLLLTTGQGNLEFAGYTVEVVDESGAPVVADDPTAWRVVAQDPGAGPADPGTTVVLTVVELPAATPAG